MKKLFIKTAIATALLSAGLMAQALTIKTPGTLGALNGSGSYILADTEIGLLGGLGSSFYDEFVFSVGPNSSVNLSFDLGSLPAISSLSASLYSGALGGANAGVFKFNGLNNPWGSAAAFRTTDLNGFFSDPALASGTYTLQVTGKKPVAGVYFGDFQYKTLTVTPVPEPETYGMLLAGLGLVGFIATRRRKGAALLAA